MDTPARVFLACPRYGAVEWEVAFGVMQVSMRHQVTIQSNSASLLACNFNQLWCEALNRREELGLTHFAMMHSDIAPQPFWLDTLIGEQQRVGADVLSCVVPIKNKRGLTSTGVLYRETGHVRRFTLKETFSLPTTFTIADTPHPDQVLVVNTGLWLCDFTQPWVEQVHFEIKDSIVRRPSGKFQAQTLPEDWHFSAQCAGLNLMVAATRIVPLGHFGRAEYRNDSPWGDETDTGE